MVINMYDEDDYLMLSGIQHFIFCQRQWALIHIEKQWQENYLTTSGRLMHKKAHSENAIEKRGTTVIVRGLRVFSNELGISGQCDIVELHQSDVGIHISDLDGRWTVLPIEYKRGHEKDGIEDQLQLCAEAVCLEEMLCTNISYGYLFYGENKRRTEVIFSEELRQKLNDTCKIMHDYTKKGFTPKVKKKKKCDACSLKDVCLPTIENQSVGAYYDRLIRSDS